jgi:hypothetical protein
LYLVFRLLSPAELRELCLVNKSFRTIAELFLYSKVEWTWKDPEHPPPIAQLLRTILCRPQLGAYIKNIHFDHDKLSQHLFRRQLANISVSGAEMDGLIAFIRGTKVPYINIWIQGLSQGETDAFVALLLAQLSNLRCLYLGPTFIERSVIIGMFLRSALDAPMEYRLPDFRHLQDVSFLCWADQNYSLPDNRV